MMKGFVRTAVCNKHQFWFVFQDQRKPGDSSRQGDKQTVSLSHSEAKLFPKYLRFLSSNWGTNVKFKITHREFSECSPGESLNRTTASCFYEPQRVRTCYDDENQHLDAGCFVSQRKNHDDTFQDIRWVENPEGHLWSGPGRKAGPGLNLAQTLTGREKRFKSKEINKSRERKASHVDPLNVSSVCSHFIILDSLDQPKTCSASWEL